MNPGEFNRRIVIQNFTTATNENGFREEKWVDYKTRWAKVENLKGREYWAAKAVQSETTIEFTIRHMKELEAKDSTKKYRIKFNETLFNITFIDNIYYRNKFMIIKALEVS